MSARRHLITALTEGRPGKTATLQDVAHAEQLVDAVIAEARAEAADDVHRAALPAFAPGERPELVARVVRAVDWRLARYGADAPYFVPKDTAPDFFQPGHDYSTDRWTFRCETTSHSPTTSERRALGWMHKPGYGWYPTALDPDDWEHGGWTVVSEGGEGR